MTDTERLLILNMSGDVGEVRIAKLLERFGSLERIFKAGEEELAVTENIGKILASKIKNFIDSADIDQELRLIKKHGVRIITFLDKEYPDNLRNTHSPPMLLYIKGEILPKDNLAIGMVGSRRASLYGMDTAEKLSFELCARGITVVSGLARGIDSSSHRGALKAGGRTVAVLGSGIANIYPEEHSKMADEISLNGAVISEFPMTMIPDRRNFPARNRIISGLSLGVVVVEAAGKSGALITADFAAEQGREVFAVPGKINSYTSKGTNNLIKEGARLVESVEDIIEELNLEVQNGFQPHKDKMAPELDKRESLVYNLLSDEPRNIDELAEKSRMDISGLSGILFEMEFKKLIRQLPGKNYIKL